MRISRVLYRQLVSDPGSYSNRAVEAEATVAEGENPETVLAGLVEWVHGQLGIGPPPISSDRIKLAGDLRNLADRIDGIPF